MIKTDITLPLRYNNNMLLDALVSAIPVAREELRDLRILRRTLVSNGDGKPYYRLSLAISLDAEREARLLKLKNRVSACPELSFEVSGFRGDFRPVVVGAGPCGLFAALTLAEAGARPIVLERGLPVKDRAKRVELFNTLGILDTECNVQFGEGGAGTYSDGKLKSGAMDKYKTKVLTEFVSAGASEEILFCSNAHIGTDKLSGIVSSIRERIELLGGEVVFCARVSDLEIKDGVLSAVLYDKDGAREKIPTRAAIFATGHSAVDTVRMLRAHGLSMEARGFGIGLRIEHPREYINKIIYRDDAPYIEQSASYHLVTHLPSGRSVYSFCMCPGGSVVAAVSEQGGIVTNGMSDSDRMADNSNAALLVSVTPSDFESSDPLSGFELQRKIEGRAFSLTDGYRAPAFRLDDFLHKRQHSAFGDTLPTYPLGVQIRPPEEYLPDFITSSLREAMPDFDLWIGGYKYDNAVLTGPETRSTSPVRILREDNGCAVGFSGIYPAGEGAGYSGGILSSATDGVRAAERLILTFSSHPC